MSWSPRRLDDTRKYIRSCSPFKVKVTVGAIKVIGKKTHFLWHPVRRLHDMSVFKHTTWIPVGLVYQLPALRLMLVLNQSIAGHMTYPHHVPTRNIPVISGCALAGASPQERCRLGYCPVLSALFKLGQLGGQKIMRSSTNDIWNWWKIHSSGGKISLFVGWIPSVEGKISILENYLCGAKIQKHPNPSLDGEIKIYS